MNWVELMGKIGVMTTEQLQQQAIVFPPDGCPAMSPVPIVDLVIAPPDSLPCLSTGKPPVTRQP